MKIDYAIHSVDDNPLYADFWPLVSKIWKKRMGIEPILLVVKKSDTFKESDYDSSYGTIINVNPEKEYEIYLQCLWIRYWYPSQMPEKISIISDIDMFPISKKYFIDQIYNIDDEKYVHLNYFHDNLPSCYHVSKGKNFKKVLDLPKTFNESLKQLCSSELKSTNHMGFSKWGIDESYATKKVFEYPNKNEISLLKRKGGNDRIDRSCWHYDESLLDKDHYIDSHSVRPYQRYKKEIDELVEKLAR